VANQSTPNAKILGRAVLVTLPDGTTDLYGDIEVDCQLCGQGVIHIPGHHMKAVRDMLIAWCDEHPGEINKAHVTVVKEDRFTMEGRPGNPRNN
jgi:hypothetical protein